MGRAAGVKRRKQKNTRLNYRSNNKLKKMKLKQTRQTTKIADDKIADAWDKKKSLPYNLANMGLTHDPNQLIPKPSKYASMGLPEPETLVDKERERYVDITELFLKKQLPSSAAPSDPKSKKFVAQELEQEVMEMKPGKNFKFSPDMSKLIVHMIERHGDDFNRMQNDPLNRYQMSAGQIRSLIKRFMSIPVNRDAYFSALKQLHT